MNKQFSSPEKRGIEWTDYTWNPTAGCFHGCTWKMPDGSIAECYAKLVAERLARSSYDHGFEHHYWRPHLLNEPLQLAAPSKIFVGSMADLFGHWVPEEQIQQVLNTMKQANWHTFQTLSKYPVRIPNFNPFPSNVWVGVSLPAGHLMSSSGGEKALYKYLSHIENIVASVRFLSCEPLWFDAGEVFKKWIATGKKLPFEWLIIGAASNGPKQYQPEEAWVKSILSVAKTQNIPVFFKGNLHFTPRHECFPSTTLGKDS